MGVDDGYVPVVGKGVVLAAIRVAFLGKSVCGEDVAIARFARPDAFEFRPGQWIRLTLKTAEGAQTKTFSLASAPADSVLEIATRLTGSAFKNALATLSPGDEVEIVGPGGRLRIPTGADRVACLVGGVGVTPVRSILRDASQTGRRFEDVVLFYGDRGAACTAYREELESYAAIGVRVVAVYEHADEHAGGERGFITAEMVRRHVETPTDYSFVVSGPPVMVVVMERLLDDLGIPAERRAVESFGPTTAMV